MAAAAKSAKATARATNLLRVIAEVPGRWRRYAERYRQGIDGARRADPERPRRLESGDGNAAGPPGVGCLNTRAIPAEPCAADRRTLGVLALERLR
jgi:hypothetical protein